MTARLVDPDRLARWLEGPAGRRRLAAWAEGWPGLAGWSVADLIDPVGSPATDAMQAALVAVAQDGDGDAAVLLLVQLRPGLTRIVANAAGGGWSWPEAVDEVRAAFYETVYRHRLDRRPTKIAANLVLDTRQRVGRWQRRSRPHPTPGGRPPALATGPEASAHPAEPADPAARLAAVGAIRDAVDRLPGSAASRRLTADLAYRAWFLEQPRSVIARDLGLGTGNVATRLHRLRAAVDRRDLIG